MLNEMNMFHAIFMRVRLSLIRLNLKSLNMDQLIILVQGAEEIMLNIFERRKDVNSVHGILFCRIIRFLNRYLIDIYRQ